MKEEILNDLSSKINEEFTEFRQENGFVSLNEQLKNAKTSDDLKIIRRKLENKKELLHGLTNENIKKLSLKKSGFINVFALIGLLTTIIIIGFSIGYLIYKLSI
mgnify:CR=1 FL=1